VVATDALAPQRTFELFEYFNNGQKFFFGYVVSRLSIQQLSAEES
jgi:hypothetical protein